MLCENLLSELCVKKKFTFTAQGKTIKVWYDAAGRKLKKATYSGETLEEERVYDDGIEYVKTGTGAFQLEAVYHAEGRVRLVTTGSSTAAKYEYTLRDHLGNARVTFSDLNGDHFITWNDAGNPGIPINGSEILEVHHYFPFGHLQDGPWEPGANNPPAPGGIANKYRFNGKELNTDFGLNWSDYGARWYDGVTGRWWSVDPLAGKYLRWSPYNYGVDNPLRFIDTDGMQVNDNIYRNLSGDIVAIVRTASTTDDFYTINNAMGVTYDGSHSRTAAYIRLTDTKKNIIFNEVQNDNQRPLAMEHVAKSEDGLTKEQISVEVALGYFSSSEVTGSRLSGTPNPAKTIKGRGDQYLGTFGINGEVIRIGMNDPMNPSTGIHPAETMLPLPTAGPGTNKGTSVGTAAALPANMSTTYPSASGSPIRLMTTSPTGNIVPVNKRKAEWMTRMWKVFGE